MYLCEFIAFIQYMYFICANVGEKWKYTDKMMLQRHGAQKRERRINEQELRMKWRDSISSTLNIQHFFLLLSFFT